MGERDAPSKERVESTLRDVLRRHPVRLAICFGSRSRGTSNDDSDVDLAVKFDALHPEDTGYSDVYLSLLTELQSVSSTDVDLVDVHSMPPRFARPVFDHGTVLVGSTDRRDELEGELAGTKLTRERAYARIDAAVERMKAGQ